MYMNAENNVKAYLSISPRSCIFAVTLIRQNSQLPGPVGQPSSTAHSRHRRRRCNSRRPTASATATATATASVARGADDTSGSSNPK